MDEVHEANAGPDKVASLRLGRDERLLDGVDDGAQVPQGRLGVALEQLLGLVNVVLTVLLQQARRDVLDQVLILLFPVLCVTA